MAAVPPDYEARTSGPGSLAKRTDLQGSQPIRVATGQGYGSAKQQEQMQQAVRLPSQTQGGTSPPSGGTSGASGAPVGPSPRELLGMLGGAPTAYPEAPLSAPRPRPPTATLAMKADALRYLAALPFASPEISEMLHEVENEINALGSEPFDVGAFSHPDPVADLSPEDTEIA